MTACGPDLASFEHMVRELFPPKSYGNKPYLMGEVMQDLAGYYVLKDRKSNPCGYDCGDVALATSKLLLDAGIANSIYSGEDELGLFSNHFFVVEEERKAVVDGVCLYPFVGAMHAPKARADPLKLGDGMLYMKGLHPISFAGDTTLGYVSFCGLVGGCTAPDRMREMVMNGNAFVEASLETIRIECRKPVESVVTRAHLNLLDFDPVKDSYPPLPPGASMRERMQRFSALSRNGFAKMGSDVYALEPAGQGKFRFTRRVRNQNDMDREHASHFDVLLHMIDSVPWAEGESKESLGEVA
jgi:hypothetical protein